MVSEIVIFLIKYIGMSAAIRVLYLLLFKNKAAFNTQRIMLLIAPLIAAGAALISVDAINVNSVIPSTLPLIDGGEAILENLNQTYQTSDAQSHTIMVENGVINIKLIDILFCIWVIVSGIILFRYINGVRNVLSIQRLATPSIMEGQHLYRSGMVETPFSFWRSIYIDRAINGEKLDIVVTHEKAHIASAHYIDKLIMELYKCVSWFNPFVWINSKDICCIHEFQADQMVINGYCEIKTYKQYLFEEAGFSVPEIANGFNNSLIKQRFIAMRNKNMIRYKTLRTIATLPIIALLFALTSFTYIKEEKVVKIVEKETKKIEEKISEIKETNTTKESKDIKDTKDIKVSNLSVNAKETKKDKPSTYVENSRENLKTINATEVLAEKLKSDTIKTTTLTKKIEVKDTVKTVKPKIKYTEEQLRYQKAYREGKIVNLKREQYQLVDRGVENGSFFVYRYDDRTELVYIDKMSFDSQWVTFSSNFAMIDPKTNDKYMAHSISDGIPFNKLLIINGQKGKNVMITMTFPPLPRSVKEVYVVETNNPEQFMPANSGESFNFKAKVLNGKKKKPYKVIPDGTGKVITMENFQ